MTQAGIRTGAVVISAAVMIAVLTGCSATPPGSAAAASAPQQPRVSVPPSADDAPTGFASPTATPGQPTISGPGQVRTDPPVSTDADTGADLGAPIDAANEAAAGDAASGFVGAFIDKTITGQAWEAGWMPYLTDDAQAAYEDTGQLHVPGRTLTGITTVAANSTNSAAVADVPTDAGTYQVQLNRISGSWKVLRALLPSDGDGQ